MFYRQLDVGLNFDYHFPQTSKKSLSKMEKRMAEYGRKKAMSKPAASAVLSIEGRRMNL